MAKAKAPQSEKGDQAEGTVLTYLREQNRPYGATDISLNLKGQVSKTVVQKCLVSLAEKGLLMRKDYGKVLIFSVAQKTDDVLPAEELAATTAETESKKEQVAILSRRVKGLQIELNETLSAPLTLELDSKLDETKKMLSETEARLGALRSGSVQLLTKAELDGMQISLKYWRKMAISRRKAFKELWAMMSDVMENPSEREEVYESLGFEDVTVPDLGAP